MLTKLIWGLEYLAMVNKIECSNQMCDPNRCYLLNNLKHQYDNGSWDTKEGAQKKLSEPKLGGYIDSESTNNSLSATRSFMEKWHCARPNELLAEIKRWDDDPRKHV